MRRRASARSGLRVVDSTVIPSRLATERHASSDHRPHNPSAVTLAQARKGHSATAPVRRRIVTASSDPPLTNALAHTRSLPCSTTIAESGQKVEIAELGAHNPEVSSVECGDLRDAESFCRCDDRSVSGAKGKVSVLGNKFSDPHPVACVDVFGEEVASCQVTQKSDLGICAKASADEVSDFGNDERRDDEGSRVSLEQIEASGVMAVVAIDVGVERASIDDQSDDCTSAARISSMRSEMSSRPLAPAPAARSRRLPGWVPRNVSIASRVRSDTVLPRRSASCRRRASSSSGSFTVVRCMYASILRGRRCRHGAHFTARIHDSDPRAIATLRPLCRARESRPESPICRSLTRRAAAQVRSTTTLRSVQLRRAQTCPSHSQTRPALIAGLTTRRADGYRCPTSCNANSPSTSSPTTAVTRSPGRSGAAGIERVDAEKIQRRIDQQRPTKPRSTAW